MRTDTRQALIDAAREVFLQHGFARATTKEIAQAAGVAEGTIYRHFDDKYALFHEVFLSLTAGIVAELRRLSERAGHDTVRDNLACLFAMVGSMQEQLSSLMASMWADPEVARNFGGYVREHARMGSSRRGRCPWWPSISGRSRSWAGSETTSTPRRPPPWWSRCPSPPACSAP